MAYRRHIVAVRNSTNQKIAEVAADLPLSEWQEANGWWWAMGSVWSVNAYAILKATDALDGPVLLATTEDGCRWLLYLQKSGMESFATYHEFSGMTPAAESREPDDAQLDDIYGDEPDVKLSMVELGAPSPIPTSSLPPLDFEDEFFMEYEDEIDDDEDYVGSTLELVQEDYVDRGMPLPATMIDQLRNVNDEEFNTRFSQLHAVYIAEALGRFDIPHDRDRVLEILTGQGVTEAEMESDVGNLWRFLEHIGLGEQFTNALHDFEDSESEHEEPEEDHGFVQEVITNVSVLELHSLLDGPAVVSLVETPLLFRITDCMDTSADGVFTFTLPQASQEFSKESLPSYACIAPFSGGHAIGFHNKETLLAPKARARIGGWLATLPENTGIEFLMDGSMIQLRFSGVTRSGNWVIESASVQLHDQDLHDMLALFRQAEARQPQTARSEEEADVVMKAAKRHMMLFDSLPHKNGLQLIPNSRDEANALCALLFHQRFPHRWNFDPIRDAIEEKFVAWSAIEWETPLPVTDALVFKGAASRYFEPDYDASCMDVQMKSNASKGRDKDEQFGTLGYELIGDMVCEKVGPCILRCYANESRNSYGVYYIAPYGQTWVDFFIRFTDDTTLTTTNGMNEGSFRELRILARECPGTSITKLHAEHLEGINRLTDRNMVPAAIIPTAKGIADAVDNFLVRRLGADD